MVLHTYYRLHTLCVNWAFSELTLVNSCLNIYHVVGAKSTFKVSIRVNVDLGLVHIALHKNAQKRTKTHKIAQNDTNSHKFTQNGGCWKTTLLKLGYLQRRKFSKMLWPGWTHKIVHKQKLCNSNNKKHLSLLAKFHVEF